MNVAIFASHNGSDLQAVIDACRKGKLKARVCAVFSNNSDSRALLRAKEANIDSYHVSAKVYGNEYVMNNEILKLLDAHQTDIIFLAGYLKRFGHDIVKKYHNRVFNIHPSLLPKYGGQGMYGITVHQAVVKAQEKISGITIHRVNDEYDRGEIVAQTTVPVLPYDTAEILAARVLEREHEFIVEVIGKIVDGDIPIG
ncbi:MAG: phosphoribosylglycinamide formyltransferase [Dehalococcoidia bacterium]|nr:phosphoribosylglycinamide formyltransferase [Dehalococcoidia bacterium]